MLALLVLGVVGAVTPLVPGALLWIAGVLLYWWSTGFDQPGLLFVVGVLIVGVGAFLVDRLAGTISSKVGGASTKRAIVAAVVGTLGFFVAGPIGVIAGVAVAVFATEYYCTATCDRARKLRCTPLSGCRDRPRCRCSSRCRCWSGFSSQ